MLVGEIHAIGVLDAGDLIGVMLDFQVGLEDLDVHQFAFFGIAALGAAALESQVAVMCFHEPLHQPGHKRILFPVERFQLSGQSLSSRLPQNYVAAPLGVEPENDADAADEKRIGRYTQGGESGVVQGTAVHCPDNSRGRGEASDASFPKGIHP